MPPGLRLVLASQSPRRREILTHAGISFSVRPAHIEEIPQPNESPGAYIRRLAREKAEAVPCAPDEIILGADTVVVIDNEVLEKPRDTTDAARMLHLLSGRTHEVLTGICLRSLDHELVDSATTRVTFVRLSEAEIEDYIATGEPMDKAGGYAIQGLASKFIEQIEGCYFNVVGLPIALVYRRLSSVRLKSESL